MVRVVCVHSQGLLYAQIRTAEVLLRVVQHACQQGDLHADLKAFRQTVFKKVFKEHKDPKERQRAAITGRAGEISAAYPRYLYSQ